MLLTSNSPHLSMHISSLSLYLTFSGSVFPLPVSECVYSAASLNGLGPHGWDMDQCFAHHHHQCLHPCHKPRDTRPGCAGKDVVCLNIFKWIVWHVVKFAYSLSCLHVSKLNMKLQPEWGSLALLKKPSSVQRYKKICKGAPLKLTNELLHNFF